MLGPDVVVIELASLFKGELDHTLGPRREDHFLLNGLPATSDDRFDLLANLRQIDPERLKNLSGKALAFGNDAEQDVLGPDIVVS